MKRDPRRILLVMSTSTYRAGAFLSAAGRLGLPVTVASERRQSLAAANPDAHLVLDLGDLRAATRQALEFSRRVALRAVIGTDDEGVEPAACIAQALGLPHHASGAVGRARDKLRMRQRLAGSGLPNPEFRECGADDEPASLAGELSYPCVIKPRVSSASRGVMRIDDADAFPAAVRRIRRLMADSQPGAPRPSLLVERYIPGEEFAVEGVITAGELKVLAVYDKPDPLEGPYFEETIYVTPTRCSADARDALTDCVSRAARRLGLTHGPVHAEVRLNERGVWLVEIAPRSIGGMCSRTLRFSGRSAAGESDRNSLEELLLLHAVGEEIGGMERDPAAAGVMMLPIPASGTLIEVTGLERARSVRGIEQVLITAPLGQPVVAPPAGSRYLGFLFSRAGDPLAAEQALRQAYGCLEVRIEPR